MTLESGGIAMLDRVGRKPPSCSLHLEKVVLGRVSAQSFLVLYVNISIHYVYCYLSSRRAPWLYDDTILQYMLPCV